VSNLYSRIRDAAQDSDRGQGARGLMALYDVPEPPGLGGRREAGGPFRPTGADDVARLFRERHAELVRLAALVVGDRATAEDVVQDVFARLCARNLLPGLPEALGPGRMRDVTEESGPRADSCNRPVTWGSWA
jgi:hypothetical protein